MKAQPLMMYIPDQINVTIASRYGAGNNKLGYNVFTYSRLAGHPDNSFGRNNTCPGATTECEAICYAKKIDGPIKANYQINSATDEVPPIPDPCSVLRIHVSGDFDSVAYIENWMTRLTERLDVTAWAYTRSWRVPELLPALERLRALANMQLFASMDASCIDSPPVGWRRAWIHRQDPNGPWPIESRLFTKDFNLAYRFPLERNLLALNRRQPGEGINENLSTPAYVCPEETGHKPDCVSCGYCFEGQKHDVVFLEH